ncbi:MAG: pyrroline-5-carboxylate reductase [Flavobacteriales bacterium]|nr:pyrroline-5-carboxylate reductase [Flavobacteriales bacterium]|tara:strand:+ start:11602 stop:12402 length:801 start_codon:yes stop_codon:yes gene_type:complete
MKLTVIGGGNMGLTYAKGIHKAGLLGETISILEKETSYEYLKNEEKDFYVFNTAEDCIPSADIILIAVKPYHARAVFEEIQYYTNPQQLIISVMAGVKISTIQQGLHTKKIVRSMPNLPAMIGKGMTVFTSSPSVTKKEDDIVEQLLASTGKALKVDSEDEIDKSTGLSGSGTAYILYFMEGLMNAASEFGFTNEEAKQIVTQTFEGAVELFQQNDLSTSEWINKVCSKGGTTIEAIKSFERNNVKDSIKKGAVAAYNRAVELGNS